MRDSAVKRIWMLFFILNLGVVLWFFVHFMIHMRPYLRLDGHAFAEINSFSVKKLGEDKFAVEALFTYKVKGKEYQQAKSFSTPIFLNEYAAESHIQAHWKKKDWTVWYNQKNPEIASLQKLFPFQKLFNCFLSLGVLIYFFWLRTYTKRLNA